MGAEGIVNLINLDMDQLSFEYTKRYIYDQNDESGKILKRDVSKWIKNNNIDLDIFGNIKDPETYMLAYMRFS